MIFLYKSNSALNEFPEVSLYNLSFYLFVQLKFAISLDYPPVFRSCLFISFVEFIISYFSSFVNIFSEYFCIVSLFSYLSIQKDFISCSLGYYVARVQFSTTVCKKAPHLSVMLLYNETSGIRNLP